MKGTTKVPRERKHKDNDSSNTDFSFIRLTSDKAYIERLAKSLGDDRTITEDDLLDVVDRDWKLSISLHATHGYYIVTLTDKRKRKGCHKRAFMLEHNDLATAIKAAVYSAVEHLENGYIGEKADDTNRDW